MKIKKFFRDMGALALLLTLWPAAVNAGLYSLQKGDMIRLTAPKYSTQPTIATFAGFGNDTLNFLINNRAFAMPLQKITKLEVARGKKRHTGNGALIGGAIGGLGLGLMAAASASTQQDKLLAPSPEEAFASGFLIGGVVGLVTGAIIGSGSTSIQWEEISINDLSPGSPGMDLSSKPDSFQMESSEAVASGQKTAMKSAVSPVFLNNSIRLESLEAVPLEQETENNSDRQKRKWRFSASLGATSGGPAKDIEKAMVRDGFDGTSPGGWFGGGPTEHPFSTGYGAIGGQWSIQLNYVLNRRLGIALLYGQASIGETIGYNSGTSLLSSRWLFLNYSAATISPIIIFKTGKILQLGVGPGIFITKIEQSQTGVMIYREQKTQFGAVFQGALLFPQHTRFFVKLDAQYRLIPKATYGPFTSRGGDEARSLEPFEVDFSHRYISLGFGIHL